MAAQVRTAPTFTLIVQAAIEGAAGHGGQSSEVASAALETANVPLLWRLIAAGNRAPSPLEATDPDEVPWADAYLWGNLLPAVALLPDGPRARLLPRLGADEAALPGLRIDLPPEASTNAEVRLTPRQVDLLHELAQGHTLAVAAANMFVSVSTARSSAKAIYRRLGVHDRDSAVRVARALGLL